MGSDPPGARTAAYSHPVAPIGGHREWQRPGRTTPRLTSEEAPGPEKRPTGLPVEALEGLVGDGFESDTQLDGTFEHGFDSPGTYTYVCTLHPGMDGTVIAVDA